MAPAPTSPVKVFIVDDSAVSRVAFRHLIAADPGLTVVGEARNGGEALDRIPSLAPHIVLMDIVMPGMSGLEVTRELMRSCPLPVLIISAQIGGEADLSFEALRAGALDVVGKPSADELGSPTYTKALLRRIHMLAEIPVISRHRGHVQPAEGGPRRSARPRPEQVKLVCIGASTGGPPALQKIITALPREPSWPMLVVQHMARGFIGGMARWLASATDHKVVVAEDGLDPEPGTIYVAGDEGHLQLTRRGRLTVAHSPPLLGHRPAVDRLFASVAASDLAAASVAVLLTGMGSDGARGLRDLQQRGGWTIAQDEASSVVFGMPRAAIELESHCEVLALADISVTLASLAGPAC